MEKDYRRYDFDTDMAAFEPLMPKVIEKIGKVGESGYQRDFSKESHNLPLCDTTYGADALVSADYESLAKAVKPEEPKEDGGASEIPGDPGAEDGGAGEVPGEPGAEDGADPNPVE